MKETIASKPITDENDANETWMKITSYMTESSKEALGIGKVNINVNRNDNP